MARDPDEIRQEVEQTTDRLGETVEALAFKKAHLKEDAKEAAKDKIAAGKDALVGSVSEKKDQAVSTVSEKLPDPGEVKEAVTDAVDRAKEAAGEVKDRVAGAVGRAKEAVASKLPGRGSGKDEEEPEGAPTFSQAEKEAFESMPQTVPQPPGQLEPPVS